MGAWKKVLVSGVATASDISDFDTEVENNTQVVENGVFATTVHQLEAVNLKVDLESTSVSTAVLHGNDNDITDIGVSGELPTANGGTGAADITTARSNLGLERGVDVQIHSGILESIHDAGTPSDSQILVGNSSGDWVRESGATARTSLGLGTSSQVQFGDVAAGEITADVVEVSGDPVLTENTQLNNISGTLQSSKLDADTAHLSTTQTFTGVKSFTAADMVMTIQNDTSSNAGTTNILQCYHQGNARFSVKRLGYTYAHSLGVGTTASTTQGEIRASNEVTAYYGSDIAMKKNLTPISNPLDKVLSLSGYDFKWKAKVLRDRGGEDGYYVREKDVGIIAQEVEKVCPEIVATREDGHKAVKYEKLVPLLIESIKELTAKVLRLEDGNN